MLDTIQSCKKIVFQCSSEKFLYQVTSSMKEIFENGLVEVFGLLVEPLHPSTYVEDYCYLEDVTSKKEFAEKLMYLMCDQDVYPVHIKDILEDIL